MSGINRSRITAWPIDAWAKRLTTDHETDPAGKAAPLWWCDLQLWVSIPTGWTHIGFAEIGDSANRNYDRGALLRHDGTQKMALWTGHTMRNINQRKAIAATGASRN